MEVMRWVGIGIIGLGLIAGCGDSSADACSSLCDGVAQSCLDEFDIPAGDCFDTCQSQIDAVGEKCVTAIADTIKCLGTCEEDELSEADLLACQDEALRINDHCENLD